MPTQPLTFQNNLKIIILSWDLRHNWLRSRLTTSPLLTPRDALTIKYENLSHKWLRRQLTLFIVLTLKILNNIIASFCSLFLKTFVLRFCLGVHEAFYFLLVLKSFWATLFSLICFLMVILYVKYVLCVAMFSFFQIYLGSIGPWWHRHRETPFTLHWILQRRRKKNLW